MAIPVAPPGWISCRRGTSEQLFPVDKIEAVYTSKGHSYSNTIILIAGKEHIVDDQIYELQAKIARATPQPPIVTVGNG
jgi:uncharacterized protein YlzI (FlbEa/FlbD family)